LRGGGDAAMRARISSHCPMRLRLTLFLYNLLLPFAMLVMLPANVLRMRRRGGYGGKFWERCGIFDEDVQARMLGGRGRTWWIHAVSVGEVNVARKLIAEIQRRDPDRPVVLSVTTSTGRAVAEENPLPGVTVIYSPLDFGWVVRAVLRRIQPECYLLMESELWPNLVRRATLRGIPVVLANARLSPRSERRYLKFRALAQPVFAMLDRVLVQDGSDVSRWTAIGVPRARIKVTGSIKYDQGGEVNEARVQEFRALLESLWDEPLPPLLLAASTHAGEERALAEVFLRLREEVSGLRLLVAPRHAERRAEVIADLAAAGLRPALRSAWSEAPLHPDALIIDSTGELRDWQRMASVVVMGKSFLSTGGQNPAEAIAAGVPVVTGPHMENFAALMNLLRSAGGITEVPSLETLPAALREIFADPDKSRGAAARGRAALDFHRGAAARTVEEILPLTKAGPEAVGL
jgi:3-deoxy-D-manno-octulosonic-acid transferase